MGRVDVTIRSNKFKLISHKMNFKVQMNHSWVKQWGVNLVLAVLAAVLDGYSGARLERSLTQGDNRLADSVGAHNGLMGRGPQFFYLDGVPAKGQTPEEIGRAHV